MKNIGSSEKQTAANDKKKKIILTSVIALLVVAVAAALIAINITSNDNTASQPESNSESSNPKNETDDKSVNEGITNGDSSSNETDFSDGNAVPNGNQQPDDENSSGSYITIPEDVSIEELIDEFNTTTDPERKEELRLILEELLSYAEEVPAQ